MIKTIAEIDPSKIYTTTEQYKAIKKAKSHKPFDIKNKDVAEQLIMLDLIETERYKIPVDKESMTEDEYQERCAFPDYEETGKYLLTIEGQYIIEYKRTKTKSKFLTEFRAWVTLAIAVLAFLLSIYSLYLSNVTP